jgi:hypothetical protein
MEKVIVKFIKGNGVYVAGDCTQLQKAEADKLLAEKIIEILDVNCPQTEPPIDLSNLPPLPADKFICSICGKEFKTEKSLQAHKIKAHKIK